MIHVLAIITAKPGQRAAVLEAFAANRPAVLAEASARDLAFGQAVAKGVSCEPPAGSPDLPAVVEALRSADGPDLFVVVEQDLYPVDFDVPAPIAARTRAYLREIDLG